jgi:hypothetical protein
VCDCAEDAPFFKGRSQREREQSKAKQSKAKQSKAKQSRKSKNKELVVRGFDA